MQISNFTINRAESTHWKRITALLVLNLLSACNLQSKLENVENLPPNKEEPSHKGIVFQLKPSSHQASPKGKAIFSSYTGSYALLVGESDYSFWTDLKSIPSELAKVQNLLESKGFKVEISFNLNAEQLSKRFKKFIDEYGFDKNNRLLFFYSGHGHTRKEKGYIVPIDTPLPEEDEKGFFQKAVKMDEVLTWMRRIEAKHALFLFDSCFSGTVFKARARVKVPRYINEAAALPVRQFISAGSANETVPAKSVFTPAFIDALRFGWGDMNKDGYVTGQELGYYLSTKVPEHSQQIPQYGKIHDYELSRGDFVFVVGENTMPQSKPTSVPPPKKVKAFGKIFRDTLKDGSQGPEMVSIPAGSFAIGRYELRFAEYDKFAEATGRTKPEDKGWGRGNRPVIMVSLPDVIAYTEWLSAQTGKKYRLPTEAEWEYAARAGTNTARYWGNNPDKACDYANVYDTSAQQKKDYSWGHHNCTDNYKLQTAPVGRFKPNAFGLFDMLGNVWEWSCSQFNKCFLRGGAWNAPPPEVRSAYKESWSPSTRSAYVGARVVRFQ